MALKFSTGLRSAILTTSSLRGALNGGEIRIYSGNVPASADSALDVSNALLCTIKTDVGGGLTFEPVVTGGIITKKLDEIWRGSVVASGTASFYRHVLSADIGDANTTSLRIQGGVALLGSDMNLTNPQLANGGVQSIEAYSITMPEA